MKTHECDEVAERLALGESLEPLAEHVASCAACARLVEVPRRRGTARREIDPGRGCSARRTVGAQHLMAVRRRRRVAVGLAGTVAAGMLGVFALTRDPAAPASTATGLAPAPTAEELAPVTDEVDEVGALVNLADTERSLRLTANWKQLERPLGGYRRLVEQIPAEAEMEGDAP